MLTVDQVFDLIRKENDYAAGWGKGTRKLSKVEGIRDADVHGGTSGPLGQPYSIADWKIFAGKYWDEIDQVLANFTPDGGAVRIRLIKVAFMIIRCLMLYGQTSDIERLAGKSSRDFPVMQGGLKTFQESTTEKGCLMTERP